MSARVGRLDAICIAATAGAAMRSLSRVVAIRGRGLDGDRYEQGVGKFSGRFQVAAGAREVSLIDAAAVVECNARLGTGLTPCDLRRNLVISGLDLDALHDAVLEIGEVRLRITGACPSCGYLSRLLGVDVRQGLRRIGGARAAIVAGGLLVVGAAVMIMEVPSACQ